jgi:deoxyribodipyrimidine photo-lyase
MAAASSPALWWVRRDLRLGDNPALQAAIEQGQGVLPLFVLDPVLLRTAGRARKSWLLAALRALDSDLRQDGGPGLSLVGGKPASVVPRVANAVAATSVHISADFAPYGRARDQAVQQELARSGIELRRTGSPYAVAPGTMTNTSGEPFAVFSPFHRAWLAHGVQQPAPDVRVGSIDWRRADEHESVGDPDPELASLAGEKPALQAWRAWLSKDSAGVSRCVGAICTRGQCWLTLRP